MSEYEDNLDAELEEIVAYLDGELSGDASAHVEQRLAADEDYRQELQGVERAWRLLDELPMATVDDRFSRTTMSLVIEAAAEDVQSRTRALPIERRRRWVSTVLAASVAAALGFLAMRLAWHDPNAQLVADLAVIDNVDIYSQFNDVEFLRELRRDVGDKLERLNGDNPALTARSEHFALVADTLAASAWVVELKEDERTTLRAKSNRFRELDAEEQDRMRQLHAAIMAADDSKELVETMLAYQAWLGGLPPVKQFELRAIGDLYARVDLIEEWAEQMQVNEALTLSNEELLAFFKDIHDPLFVVRAARGAGRDKLKDIASGPRAHEWYRDLVEMFDDHNGRDSRFYRQVMRALPDRTKSQFGSLMPHERARWFVTWVRQHTSCCGEVTQDELADFFAKELNPAERAQLLSMPADKMDQAVRFLYRWQPEAGAAGGWRWPQLTASPYVTPPPPAEFPPRFWPRGGGPGPQDRDERGRNSRDGDGRDDNNRDDGRDSDNRNGRGERDRNEDRGGERGNRDRDDDVRNENNRTENNRGVNERGGNERGQGRSNSGERRNMPWRPPQDDGAPPASPAAE